MIDKHSSINMKSATTKFVYDLKGELKFICYKNEPWEMWKTFFDTHIAGNIVNSKIEEKRREIPPILKEFLTPMF